MKALLKRILPKVVVYRLGDLVSKIRTFVLLNFARDFSQLGETVAVRRLLKGYPDRTFVEIGANDGVTASNTYGLLLDGWSGLSVEPNPRVYEKLRQNLAAFPKVTMVCCAASPKAGPVRLYLGKDDPQGLLSTISTEDSEWFRQVRGTEFVEVPGLPLTEILAQHEVPKRFALLVIDTEGMDLDILQTLDFSVYRPRLIVTEDYQPKDEQKFAFLKAHGYDLREHVGCNTFWMDATREGK